MSLKKNLAANFLGQGWSGIIGLAFIPIYIKYLGIEAYGLIGLYALLQAWLGLLDMGMTPILNREMARFTGGGYDAKSIRDLLRTIEFIAFSVALLITIGIALSADWIATSWLKVDNLSADIVSRAFVLMGLITAIRFMEGIYRSAIIGLQRQVLFNVVNSFMNTLRAVGAVGVLVWVSASIDAFFLWQGLISIVALFTLMIATYASLAPAMSRARFSLDALRGVWRFAGGMTGITFLALLLMQSDKIILSRLLSLSEYGYYALAATIAAALYMLLSPITQAWYPRLCELHVRSDWSSFVEAYHQGAQLVSVIAGSAAVVMIMFAETFLRLWTQDPALAARTAPLLSILILGNLFNGLMHIPYMTQLAYGWTGLTVRINIIAVMIIVPAVILVTPRYGAEGAAWVWAGLNAGYVLIGIHFMYRRLLTTEKWRWYVEDIVTPIGAALLGSVLLAWFWPAFNGILADLVKIVLAGVISLSAALFSATRIRQQLYYLIISQLKK